MPYTSVHEEVRFCYKEKVSSGIFLFPWLTSCVQQDICGSSSLIVISQHCGFAVLHLSLTRSQHLVQAQALVGANIRQLWPDFAEGGDQVTEVVCYGVKCYGVFPGTIKRVWLWEHAKKNVVQRRMLMTIHYADGDKEDASFHQVSHT